MVCPNRFCFRLLRNSKKGKPNPRSIFDKHKTSRYLPIVAVVRMSILHRVRQKSKTFTQPHAVLAYQTPLSLPWPWSTRASLGSTHGIGKEPRSRRLETEKKEKKKKEVKPPSNQMFLPEVVFLLCGFA